MLKDVTRDADVGLYRVLDADTNEPITDVVAACEEEGWLIRGTHGVGCNWVRPFPGDPYVELTFRRIRIVRAPPLEPPTPAALSPEGEHFHDLLNDLAEEIADTCLHPDGTWLDYKVVEGRMQTLAEHHADPASSLYALHITHTSGPNAVIVEADYGRRNDLPYGFRGVITWDRLHDAQTRQQLGSPGAPKIVVELARCLQPIIPPPPFRKENGCLY